jgi:hypothetical protein
VPFPIETSVCKKCACGLNPSVLGRAGFVSTMQYWSKLPITFRGLLVQALRPLDEPSINRLGAGVQFKIDLEEILTTLLRKQQPHISEVSISSDGEFAIYNINDRYTVRKLSRAAKEFLRSGKCERIKESALLL